MARGNDLSDFELFLVMLSNVLGKSIELGSKYMRTRNCSVFFLFTMLHLQISLIKASCKHSMTLWHMLLFLLKRKGKISVDEVTYLKGEAS